MSKIKLKRCPFCDEELEVVGRGHYYTHKINGCILQHLCFETDYKETIDRWNTRKPMQAIVERLEEKSDNIPIQYEYNYDQGFDDGICYSIDIVKEVGGMNAS